MQVIAPNGKLRVGVHAGSPLSLLRDTKTGETRGLAVELGRELARRLDIACELVPRRGTPGVLDAIRTARADFGLLNATSVRARDVAFSRTLLSLELGYLVPAHSPIAAVTDMTRAGIRIGVSTGSTSERTLPALLPNAVIVPAPSLDEAGAMLNRRELDAFATNKPILFAMADHLSGARILDERWGLEHIAIAIPKGREAGLALLNLFIDDVRASGLLAAIQRRTPLRGVAGE